MEELDIRNRTEAVCAALVQGDMGRATTDFSNELRRHLGEVLALLPLPLSEATIESIDAASGAAAETVVVRLVGATDTVMVQFRWKDRDGQPTIVEVSHLSRIDTEPDVDVADDEVTGATEGAAGDS
jgi:hypothetical protein